MVSAARSSGRTELSAPLCRPTGVRLPETKNASATTRLLAFNEKNVVGQYVGKHQAGCCVATTASLGLWGVGSDHPRLFRQQFAAEFWLAFFLKRGEPFGIVCGRAKFALGNVLLFDGFPQTNALITDLCHELARRHEGSGRALGCLGNFFTCEFQQLIFRHGPREQALFDGLLA